jgi:hypothetical protein
MEVEPTVEPRLWVVVVFGQEFNQSLKATNKLHEFPDHRVHVVIVLFLMEEELSEPRKGYTLDNSAFICSGPRNRQNAAGAGKGRTHQKARGGAEVA